MHRGRLLIRDADVVFPSRIAHAHILIENGKIVDTDANRLTACDAIVEAKGLTLIPGAIDDQVHFREPGLTHKEDLHTGSLACAAGGVTTFLEMPNTNPTTTDRAAIAAKYQRASEVCLVNFGFYIGATENNIEELMRVDNVPGIKIFIGSSTGDLLVDSQDALERIFGETSLPICAHCEDETTVRANKAALAETLSVEDHSRIRNVEAAVRATTRAIDLAKRHQHRFHVLHVSTAAELPLLWDANPWITAEACCHHLFFSTDDYARLGTLVQMNPSLKSAADAKALWRALLDGTIQVIATDHAPHTLEEKQAPYPKSPSGLPAVENSLALMLNQVNLGRCTLQQVVSWMCDAPARVWGLVAKGRIEVGYDADVVLIDMSAKKTILNENQFTKSRWSPWHGSELQGWPVKTWVAGELVFADGRPNLEIRGSRVRCDHARGGFWKTLDGIGT